MNWQFSFDGNVWHAAGSSVSGIYRTLNNPSANKHTVVDVACMGINASDDLSVLNEIWYKFQSLSIYRVNGEYDSTVMYYYGETTPVGFSGYANATVDHLIANADAPCNDWAYFFIKVLRVHDTSVEFRFAQITLDNIILEYMTVYPFFLGQGYAFPAENFFQTHCLVEASYGGQKRFYDPSYGYATLWWTTTAQCHKEWEEYSIWYYNYTTPILNNPLITETIADVFTAP